MTVFLLDINLLLALFDPTHLHHEAAHHWFGRRERAWATCPLTENGFIRIASHPSYPNSQGDAGLVTELLRSFCASSGHHFWSDAVSLLDRELFPMLVGLGSKQVTDVYLLGLAVANKGKLATFDQSIPTHAVKDGAQALELI